MPAILYTVIHCDSDSIATYTPYKSINDITHHILSAPNQAVKKGATSTIIVMVTVYSGFLLL